jgi:hypothetical protein
MFNPCSKPGEGEGEGETATPQEVTPVARQARTTRVDHHWAGCKADNIFVLK